MSEQPTDYDAGLIGGEQDWTVDQWQDYIRSEVEAANEHWRTEYDNLQSSIDDLPTTRDGVIIRIGDSVWRWNLYTNKPQQGKVTRLSDGFVGFASDGIDCGEMGFDEIFADREKMLEYNGVEE